MANLETTELRWQVSEPLDAAGSAVEAAINSLKGRIIKRNDLDIQADFGMKLATRMIGIGFVSRRMIPKVVEVSMEPSDTGTAIALTARQNIGPKLGRFGNDKINQALTETAEAIRELSQRHTS